MKLYSVGCSFTEGSGVGRANAYTKHLADLLNCEYDNFGESGHSNLYIFRKAIELIKNWNKEDLLIVQWTAPIRQELVSSEGYMFYPPQSGFVSLSYLYGQNVEYELKQLGLDNKEVEKQIYKKYLSLLTEHNENFVNEKYQFEISFGYQISLFNLLENLGYKHIHFYGWEDNCKIENVYNFVNEKFLTDSFQKYTNTTINEHPNLQGHIEWAKYLFDNLKNFMYI
jgi:hypothetical protein